MLALGTCVEQTGFVPQARRMSFRRPVECRKRGAPLVSGAPGVVRVRNRFDSRAIASTLARVPPWVWVGIAAFGILFLRRPDVLTDAQFYAEDGPVFYLGALLEGGASLLHSYAGYIHLVPRLVALLEATVPVAWAPTLANLTAFLIAAGLAAYIASDRLRAILRSRALRAVAGLTFVLLPATHEVFGTMTNVQWLLGVYLMLSVAQTDPASRLQAFADRSALAVASLTGPMSIAIAPLHLARLALRRDRVSAWQAAAVALPAAAQLFVLMHSGRPVDLVTHPDAVTIGKVMVYRAIVVPLIGVHAGAWLKSAGLPHLVIGLGATVAVAGTAALVLGLRAGRRQTAYIMIAFTALAFVATRYPASVFLNPWAGARYFFLPGAVLVGAALSAAWHGRRLGRLAAVGCLAVLTVGVVGDFSLPA